MLPAFAPKATVVEVNLKAPAVNVVIFAFEESNVLELILVNNTLEIVLLDAFNVPVEILISVKLVVVMFTVVIVPPTIKSPDKLIVPAVIVFAKIVLAVIVVVSIFIALTEPDV